MPLSSDRLLENNLHRCSAFRKGVIEVNLRNNSLKCKQMQR